MTDIVDRLRSCSVAYPEDVFPAITDEDRKAHPVLISRASAAMGRHMSKVFNQAADEIERLRKGLESIGKVRYGLELNDDDGVHLKYWHDLALEYRRIAAETLKDAVSGGLPHE